MASYEWIDLSELVRRSGIAERTVRRMVANRQISARRSGPGKRAKLEFNWRVVEGELAILREHPSRAAIAAAPRAPAPTMVTLLSEVRALTAEVAGLRALLVK